MRTYELLEDVPQMVTRVVSKSMRTNATRCGQDGRWYNQTSDLVPLDTFGPWTHVQHDHYACDVCMEVAGALIPNAADAGETRACAECVKVLVLCPQCDRVANWTLQGDSWSCGTLPIGASRGGRYACNTCGQTGDDAHECDRYLK